MDTNVKTYIRPFSSAVASSLLIDSLLGKKDNAVCADCGMSYRTGSLVEMECSEMLACGSVIYGVRHNCSLHGAALGDMHIVEMIYDASFMTKKYCPLLGRNWEEDLDF